MSRKKVGSLYKRNGVGPWIASWYDHDGRRREHSTRTTDRAAADRILSKLVADAALRRDGVIDARKDKFLVAGRLALAEHVTGYLAHCEHSGQAAAVLRQKRRHLERLMNGTKAVRLTDLTAETLERYLAMLKGNGLSARTLNLARAIAVAFFNWCVDTQRAESNPLRTVPQQNESRDRRKIRRALTDDEMSRLLAVARPRGRDLWYLAAALAGLRFGDLVRVTWGDVDLAGGTLTISQGKAKRIDVLPLHPQLRDALAGRAAAFPALPSARIFPVAVANSTRVKDFVRAGIALVDAEGRVADLHSLRTTLGTNLARQGVAPQVAQKIMRHASYKTTLEHYTVLALVDTSKAVSMLPGIRLAGDAQLAATGTAGALADCPPAVQLDPQRTPQRTVRGTAPDGATRCETTRATTQVPSSGNPSASAGLSESVRAAASSCDEPAAAPVPVSLEFVELQQQRGSAAVSAGSGAGVVPTSEVPSVPVPVLAMDPELAQVVQAWPALPAAVRAGIVALVEATKRTE